MRRLLAGLLVSMLLAAACSGDDDAASDDADLSTDTSAPADPGDGDGASVPDDPQAPPYRTVRSEDGDAMVLVPAADDTDVTISVLDPSAYPSFLAGARQSPGTVVYDLGPDGATFDEPVRFFRRVSVSNVGPDVEPWDIPIVLLFTADAEGNAELLDDHSILRAGDELWIGADIDHFSPGVTINAQRTAETNEVFGELLRSVRNADGSQAIDVLPETAPIIPDAGLQAIVGIGADGQFVVPGGAMAAGATGNLEPDHAFAADLELAIGEGMVVDDGAGWEFRELVGLLPSSDGASADDLVPVELPAAVASFDVDVELQSPLLNEVVFVPVRAGVLFRDPALLDGFRRAGGIGGADGPVPPTDLVGAPRVFTAEVQLLVDHAPPPPDRSQNRIRIASPPGSELHELLDLFPEDVYGFTADPPGPDGASRVVSIRPLVLDGSEATADTAIECYCRYRTGLLISSDTPDPDGMFVTSTADGDLVSADGIMVPAPASFFRPGGRADPLDVTVGAEEGPIFVGGVDIAFSDIFADGFESGDVSAWSTTR